MDLGPWILSEDNVQELCFQRPLDSRTMSRMTPSFRREGGMEEECVPETKFTSSHQVLKDCERLDDPR